MKNNQASLIIPSLKEIFNNSVPIISESEKLIEGHKIHSNFNGYHHYLSKIKINDQGF